MKHFTRVPPSYLFLAGIIFLIAFISLIEYKSSENSTNLSSINTNKTFISNSYTKEKEEENVTVVIEYLPQKSSEKNLVFDITLDTHSVDLNPFDFSKDLFLEKDGVQDFPLISVPSGSDHHRKAEIIFSRVKSPFTIVLQNLNGIPKREFQFEISERR